MKRRLLFCLVPILAASIYFGYSIDRPRLRDEGPALFTPVVSSGQNPLIGTWRLDPATNQDSKDPQKTITTKVFGKTHWCVTYRHADTGIVEFHSGGTYKIEGDVATERLEYTLENTKHLIGEKNRFKFEVSGDKLRYEGLDRKWKEIWVRID